MIAERGMAKDYVEHHSGAYLIAGIRVSLDSVVYAFLRGESQTGSRNPSQRSP